MFYEVELDEERATPEQIERHRGRQLDLKIQVYIGLKNLGYKPNPHTEWSQPLQVPHEISLEHVTQLERDLGVPLKITRAF